MNDLISRQAVYNILDKCSTTVDSDAIRMDVEDLPSAQIQRIVLTDDEKEALIKGIVDTLIKKINPCVDCQEFDCYGCKYKSNNQWG